MSIHATASLPLPGLLAQAASRRAGEVGETPPSSGDLGDGEIRSKEIDEQIRAAKEFESLFVSMLIKEMRKSAEGLFPGDSTDSLGVMFDMHIGKEVADAGGLGIAAQVTRYLEAQRT